MITIDILRSTFRIKCRDSQGTCFALVHDNKQYLITAKHIGTNWNGSDIEIFHEGRWKKLIAQLIGHADDPIDISIFSPSTRLIGKSRMPATTTGMFMGQDMYFLGFPYGLSTDAGDLTQNFPVPLVKKCCLSGGDYGTGQFYFDGMNNPGFSGGPIIRELPREIVVQDGKPTQKIGYQYTAVISGYRNNADKVVKTPEELHELISLGNSGIIIAYSIDEAIKLINKNPIGLSLEK